MSGEDFDFDGTEDELHDLMANVSMASHKDDINEREACKALLTWVAAYGDVPDRESAIETISNVTDFGKKVAKEWYDEINTTSAMAHMGVERIVQIKTYGDDDDIFEFHVRADGEEHVFRIESGALMSQRAFQTKMFEVCRMKVSFDDWDEQINTWLEEAELSEEMAPAIEVEHDLARDLVKNVGSTEATYDKEEFRQSPSKVLLIDGEVWVRPEMVSLTVSSHSGEVSRRKLRSIMDEYDLIAGASSRVRSGEDKLIRAWRLSEEGLDRTVMVDMDALHESAEENGGKPDEGKEDAS